MAGTGTKRSPLRLSLPEIVAAIVYGAAIGFGNGAFYWTVEPFYRGPEFSASRQALFVAWNPVFFAIGAVSAVFVVRAIRGDVDHFTRLGNIAVALPGLIYVPASILFDVNVYFCYPIGLVVMLAALFASSPRKPAWGNFLAIPVQLLVLMLLDAYISKWWIIFGD